MFHDIKCHKKFREVGVNLIHIYVCDDSIEFRSIFDQTLKKLAPQFFPKSLEYKIEESVSSSEQLLKRLESKNIDVLFLDIDMPGMNGLDLAKQITKMRKEILIIFVSGYDHYVYQVFEFFPFAYMRKDHILDELPTVLKRIADKFDRDNLVVSLASIHGTVSLDARDVIYIRSDGNYYEVKTQNGVCKCRGTLREAEKLFSGFDLYRIHSAYIVNLNHIQQVNQSEVLVSYEKKALPIAQKRLAGFRSAYAEFTIRSFNL